MIDEVLKKKYLREGEETWEDLCMRFKDTPVYGLMLEKKFSPGGSILANIGTTNSMSNCYGWEIIDDSISGIFDTMKEAAETFKRRGGVGLSFDPLRPKGTPVNNAAKTSTGAVSFAPLFSNMVNVIGQKGRRGALLIGLSIEHPDVIDFIQSKSNPEKVFNLQDIFSPAPHDMSGCNISVKISDKFMKAMQNDEDWNLEWNGKVYKTVKARELWDLLCKNAWASGDPGVLFWDTVTERCLTSFDDNGVPVIKNPSMPEFAPVLTPTGIKKFGDIEVGDIIWSSEGWTTVVRKIATGHKEVFQYDTNFGRVICTEQHKIFSHGETIPAGQAEDIDTCTGPMTKDIIIIPEIVMDGLVIGDGSVDHSKSRNTTLLFIGENDYDYFESEIKGLIIKHSYRGAYRVKTSINPDELPRTYNRVVPERYFYGNPSEVASFLRGIYSANGSVILAPNKETIARITLKQPSYELIKQVQIMLNSLGINSYITTNKPKKVRVSNGEYLCKQSYDLNIGQAESQILFMEHIGFIQKYKMKKGKIKAAQPLNHKTNYPITQIESLGYHDVWDITVSNQTSNYWSGNHKVKNCGEISCAPYQNCLLMSFNLFAYVDNGQFDWESFKQDIPKVVQFANWVIDNNHHPLPQQEEADKYFRKIGIGITGLADALAAQGLKYSSQAGRDFASNVMKTITLEAMKESIKLAKERGPAPALESREAREKYIQQSFMNKVPEDIKQGIVKYGMHNTTFTTIPPAGSISIILGNLTSGCEPLFERKYERKSRTTGKTHKIQHQPMGKAVDLSQYETAAEIRWEDRIKMQAALQEWTTDSISSTINLPVDFPLEEVKAIYEKAWELKLDGITIYRDSSKDQQVLNKVCDDRPGSIQYNCAPRRPKQLPCNIHHCTLRGEPWIVLIGLLDGLPYEIFAGRKADLDLPKRIKTGTIIKKGGGKYTLKVKDQEFPDIADLLMGDLEKALTRLLSLAMRHGVYLKFIIEQMKKASGSIVDFSAVVSRVLRKYETQFKSIDKCPDCKGDLTAEGGCLMCKSCGWSKCE